ncbi:MAG: ABC transporter permease [Draconibacterium sp.]
MIRNFIKIAWRQLHKKPLIAILQIGGLTIGLTVALLISLWVNNQLSYDRFHKNADRIYMLELHNPKVLNGMPLALAPYLRSNFAEINNVVRIRTFPEKKNIRYDPSGNNTSDNEISNQRVLFADSTFFSVFSFDFVYGNPKTALVEESSVVLIESTAKKLFKKENPIGKTVWIDGDNCTVTGVIKDVNNFHLPFEALRAFHRLKEKYAADRFAWDVWGLFNHQTYILLGPNVSAEQTQQKMSEAWKDISAKNYQGRDVCMSEFRLVPIKDIYLSEKTSVLDDGIVHGDKKLLLGLSFISFLIILLATVNFINLNITQTVSRSLEVGIHKIAGSSRRIIFFNICGEIIVKCVVSLVLAIGLVYLTLPYYNNLIYVNLRFSELFHTSNLLVTGSSFALIVVLAGVAPALTISSFSPVLMLKKLGMQSSEKGKLLNKVFLGIQYVIAIIVLTITLLVNKQVSFLMNSNTGVDMHNALVMNFKYEKHRAQFLAFKERLLQCPTILKVSYGTPPGPQYGTSYWRQDMFEFDGREVQTIDVDIHPEYFDFLDVPIVQGRNFFPGFEEFKTQGPERVIINETAAKAFKLDNPVGTVGKRGNRKIEIIGVVKDFHGNSLKTSIKPTVYYYWFRSYRIMVKYAPGTYTETRDYITSVSEELLDPNSRPTINHIDDLYYAQYKSEEKLGNVFWWFSLLSVIIAALGLYGLSVKSIQQRIKEIGIRKSMGATSVDVLLMFLAYFAKIILVAGVFAVPAAWYLCSLWLKGYAYKTPLTWWIFAGSFLLTFAIAIVTISYKTWRAANSNPVLAIKYE